ncbi:hypothetical protein KJ763_02690, partial [Patescibacteria group bacterium]|nr:hypothetical protein [Patescibacteria group bacterium]
TENGCAEGNKFVLGYGLKTNLKVDNVVATLDLSTWHMGEGLDEDTEIPNLGYNASGTVGYKINISDTVSITPLAGAGWQHWARAEKGTESWKDRQFIYGIAGAQVDYKSVYARAVAIASDKIGGEGEVGFTINKWNLAGFYRNTAYHNARSALTGVRLGYIFDIL